MEPKVVECDGEPFFELTHAVFDCVASLISTMSAVSDARARARAQG